MVRNDPLKHHNERNCLSNLNAGLLVVSAPCHGPHTRCQKGLKMQNPCSYNLDCGDDLWTYFSPEVGIASGNKNESLSHGETLKFHIAKIAQYGM